MPNPAKPELMLLGKYRELDDKNAQGEVAPENDTLNSTRVRGYLDTHGFNVSAKAEDVESNFNQRFNLKTGLEMLDGNHTKGETEMHRVISQAQQYLTSIDLPTLLEENSEGAFRSTLNKELLRRGALDREQQIIEAYLTYQTVRQLALNLLIYQQKFTEKLEAQKTSTEKDLKESFTGVIQDVSKNYSKMSGGEKLAAVGGLLALTIWFIKSENETVKGIRDTMWSGLKIAGIGTAGAVGFNYIYKLFSGKTAYTAFSEYTSSTVGKEEFLTDTFKTDEEKAALLRKSFVYLGDKDFLDLSKRYREAKARGEDEIRLPTVFDRDMNPKEIYTALDVFFTTYPAATLETKYRNYSDRQTWLQVVVTETAEDNRIPVYHGNLPSRVVDNVKEYSTRSWNWLWAGEGFGVLRYMYVKAWGKEDTPEKMVEWGKKKFENSAMDETALAKKLEYEQPSSALYFKNALSGVNIDPATGVKFSENPGDGLYVVSQVSLTGVAGDPKAASDALKSAQEKADTYIKTRYPQLGDKVEKFRSVTYGVQVVGNSSYYLFIKMPEKGTSEYERRNLGLEVGEAHSMETPDDKIFTGFNYNTLKGDALRENFRLWFLVDAGQTAEINKIVEWYNINYRSKNMKADEVMKIVFEDEDVKKKALQQTGVLPSFQRKEALYKDINDDLTAIERDAARKIKGDTDAVVAMEEALKAERGNTLRLSIIGDSAARTRIPFDPMKPNAIENIKEDYEQWCKEFIEAKNLGRI